MSDNSIQFKPAFKQNCGTGFDADELVATSDFDFAEMDGESAVDLKAEIAKKSAQAVAKMFAKLLAIGGNTPIEFFIAANCLAFAAHIHPNQSESAKSIASSILVKYKEKTDENGNKTRTPVYMEKAAFLRRVNQWRHIMRLPPIAGAWSKEARKTISSKTKQHHEKRIKSAPKMRGLIARLNSRNQNPRAKD